MADYISTVSRHLDPTSRSWVSVVYQTGKSILDSELNLAQSIQDQRRAKSLPSGVLSEYPTGSEGGFVFYAPTDPNFEANQLVIEPFHVNIGGQEVYVSATNDSGGTGFNYINLSAPSTPTGTAPDIKRTDFVFLEVWRALVNPATNASGYFRVNSNASLAPNDIVTLDGTPVGAPSAVVLTADVDFSIGATEAETARNIRDAINALTPVDLGGVSVTATTRGTGFVFLTFDSGVDGNSIILSTTIVADPSAITVSNPTGGSNGEGIPSPNKIYYAGNTESDASAHLTDDITDPTLNAETTRRVQMQYRFRVYSEDYNFTLGTGIGVNPKVQPDGFSNSDILARGGSASPQVGYSFSRATDGSFPFQDTGLYYAGDGTQNSATDLNTVDGYVYAIPICFVFRRNEGEFNPENQANNGLLHDHALTTNTSLDTGVPISVPAGKSDRPDGLFADQVASSDVLDLRKKVFPRGVDYSAELDRQFGTLLDNALQTWFMDSSDFRDLANGSGEQSVLPLVCDEIGRSQFAPTPGQGSNTNRGSFIRNFDHVATRFSDAPHLARLVLEVFPDGTNNHDGAVVVSGTGTKWYEGDEITVDISQLDSSSAFRYWEDVLLAGQDLDLDDLFPTGTKVIDVLENECWHDDGDYNSIVDQSAYFSKVEGLGTTSITVTMGRNLTDVTGGQNIASYKMVGNPTVGEVGSPRRVFLTLLVEYPAQEGLSATPSGASLSPDVEVFPTGSVVEHDSTQRASDSEAQPPLIFFREGVREVALERVVNPITDTFVTSLSTALRLPWKLHVDDSGSFDPTMTDNTNGNAVVTLDLLSSGLGSTNSYLSWNAPFAGHRLVTVETYPRSAVPSSGINGYQVGVYYRAKSSQTFGAKNAPLNVPNEVTLKPIKVSEKLWSIQAGSSTSEDAYPYTAPSVQLGVHPSVVSFSGESDLMGSTRMVLEDISLNSGMMALSTVLPMDSTGNITLTSPDLDAERRVVYKEVSSGYLPNAYSQSLDESVLHKNALPFLARIESTSAGDNEVHFRNGEIVLVVLVRLSHLPYESDDSSRKNKVLFSSESRTVACIYKTQDLLLSGV